MTISCAIRLTGAITWQLHCAAVHGRAPHLPCSEMNRRKRSRCLICDKMFFSLAFYVTKLHEAGGDFENPFPCPECARLGTLKPLLIESRQAWQIHCASVHKDGLLATSVAEEGKQGKEPREEGEYEALSDASNTAAQNAGHKRAIPMNFVIDIPCKGQRSGVERGTI